MKAVRLRVGTRVMDERGEFGTVVRWLGRHNGYGIRFDQRFPYAPDVERVSGIRLTPTDPELHDLWEAMWPSFIDRRWTAAALRTDD